MASARKPNQSALCSAIFFLHLMHIPLASVLHVVQVSGHAVTVAAMETADMWKKVEPTTEGRGPAPATQITVARYAAGNAFLRLPASFVTHRRADIFVDGTRIGILQHDKGTYKIGANGGKANQINVPAAIKHLVPMTGAVPLQHAVEGAMIVIDLADITKTQIAGRLARAFAAE